MNDKQLGMLWLCSFRYCLGRMTYIVGDFVEAAIAQWDSIPEEARQMIIKELQKAFADDNTSRQEGRNYHPLGHDCDRAEWGRLLQFAVEKDGVQI